SAILGLCALTGLDSQFTPFKRTTVEGPISVRPFANGIYIQHIFHYNSPHAENPLVPLPAGTANSLPVGKVLPFPQGQQKRNFPGILFTGWYPPDPDMGVGPNHVVITVNSSFAVFTKSGQELAERDLIPFFAPVEKSTFVFDPCVFYDRLTDRYFITAD